MDATMKTRTSAQSIRLLRGLRSALTTEIVDRISAHEGTQAEFAAEIGISRPQLSRLKQGETDSFSLDWLVEVALRTGLTVRVAVARPYRKK